MAETCGLEWDTSRDEEDWDGDATHRCGRAAGHEEADDATADWHLCHDHLACTPIYGATCALS